MIGLSSCRAGFAFLHECKTFLLICKYLTSNVKVYQMKCTEKPDEMMTNFNFITGQFCKNKLIKKLICLICISILSEGRGWILGQKTGTGSEGGKYE